MQQLLSVTFRLFFDEEQNKEVKEINFFLGWLRDKFFLLNQESKLKRETGLRF